MRLRSSFGATLADRCPGPLLRSWRGRSDSGDTPAHGLPLRSSPPRSTAGVGWLFCRVLSDGEPPLSPWASRSADGLGWAEGSRAVEKGSTDIMLGRLGGGWFGLRAVRPGASCAPTLAR